MLKKLEIGTSKRVEFIDITPLISLIVSESNVKEGICIVYVPHTTCGLTVNEHADPSVVSDIINQVGRLIPQDANYEHMEGNSDAHIKTSLFGNSLTIIISNGKLLLGAWQGIFFCEFDGPRRRNIYVKIMEG
ncbi:MAG: secondary thiamine-phosphate synthase enzyme YjbQ [Fervidobacterium sp.]